MNICGTPGAAFPTQEMDTCEDARNVNVHCRADIIRPMGMQRTPFGLTDEYLWNAEGGVPYKCYMNYTYKKCR